MFLSFERIYKDIIGGLELQKKDDNNSNGLLELFAGLFGEMFVKFLVEIFVRYVLPAFIIIIFVIIVIMYLIMK